MAFSFLETDLSTSRSPGVYHSFLRCQMFEKVFSLRIVSCSAVCFLATPSPQTNCPKAITLFLAFLESCSLKADNSDKAEREGFSRQQVSKSEYLLCSAPFLCKGYPKPDEARVFSFGSRYRVGLLQVPVEKSLSHLGWSWLNR